MRESAGRRRLKNVCSRFPRGDAAATTRIARRRPQYRGRRQDDRPDGRRWNLAQHDRPERAQALEDFYTRYADDPLIIDKWPALQAAIPEPATLDRVRALDPASGILDVQPQPRARSLSARSRRSITPSSTASTAPATISSPISSSKLDREEPAGRRAPDGRVPFLARARSDPPRPRRGDAAPRRRDALASRATSMTSWRARWRIVKTAPHDFREADWAGRHPPAKNHRAPRLRFQRADTRR